MVAFLTAGMLLVYGSGSRAPWHTSARARCQSLVGDGPSGPSLFLLLKLRVYYVFVFLVSYRTASLVEEGGSAFLEEVIHSTSYLPLSSTLCDY